MVGSDQVYGGMPPDANNLTGSPFTFLYGISKRAQPFGSEDVVIANSSGLSLMVNK